MIKGLILGVEITDNRDSVTVQSRQCADMRENKTSCRADSWKDKNIFDDRIR